MRYSLIQIKRAASLFAQIFILFLLILFTASLFIFFTFKAAEKNQVNAKIKIGIAGKDENNYFRMGIVALESMDEFGKACTFTQFKSEEAAKSEFKKGNIDIYAVIPDGFIDSIIYGHNKRVKVFLNGSQTPLGSKIISDLLTGVSSLITDTQAGIYSYHDFYKYYLKNYTQQRAEDEYQLNFEYARLILNRENLFSIEVQDSSSLLPLHLRYLCKLLVLLLFLWTLCPAFLYISPDNAMLKMLRARGYNIFLLTVKDFCSCQLLLTCSFLLPGLLFLFLSKNTGLTLLMLYPTTFFISALVIFTSQLSRFLPAVLLLNFLIALFFAAYPQNFFLKTIEAAFLKDKYFVKIIALSFAALLLLIFASLIKMRRLQDE